jgi:hypothetical protein
VNLDELAKRLVRCKHFRWMEGMLAISFQGDRRWHWRQNEQDDHLPDSDSFPDLTDPATLGCLLHLVREAWGWEGITTLRAWAPSFDGAWRVETMRSVPGLPRLRQHPTEAEALVAALEAAP